MSLGKVDISRVVGFRDFLGLELGVVNEHRERSLVVGIEHATQPTPRISHPFQTPTLVDIQTAVEADRVEDFTSLAFCDRHKLLGLQVELATAVVLENTQRVAFESLDIRVHFFRELAEVFSVVEALGVVVQIPIRSHVGNIHRVVVLTFLPGNVLCEHTDRHGRLVPVIYHTRSTRSLADYASDRFELLSEPRFKGRSAMMVGVVGHARFAENELCLQEKFVLDFGAIPRIGIYDRGEHSGVFVVEFFGWFQGFSRFN